MNKPLTPSKEISRLIEIMAQLRTPETGCPWDLKQTFRTIAPYTIEEAYEVADAIERDALGDLKEELGDLLLQVVYHSRMAEEENAFRFEDVVEAITSKMIRRHPHVFGSEDERAAGVQEGFWEKIKAEEKAEREGSSEGKQERNLLSTISRGLPALARAVKLQRKAAEVGFDWPNLGPVFEKLKEEIQELEEVALPCDPRGQNEIEGATLKSDRQKKEIQREIKTFDKVVEELGDVLFVLANIARHLKIDAESALRGANEKFERRFRYIEKKLEERGKTPEQSSLQEMDALWDDAKLYEKKH